jgi:hypothetical protein
LQKIANQLEFRQIKRRLEIGAISWAHYVAEEKEEAELDSLENEESAHSTENGENGAEHPIAVPVRALGKGDSICYTKEEARVRQLACSVFYFCHVTTLKCL